MTLPAIPGTGILVRPVDTSSAGSWKIIFRVPGKGPVDLSTLRGAPVLLQNFSFSDPFGPKDASLLFPQVSHFDRRGMGDLIALQPKISVDFVWTPAAPLPAAYPFGAGLGLSGWVPSFAWEGYTAGFGYDSNGLAVSCKGAMLGMDGNFAKPEYWARPRPYEHAIARQFNPTLHPHLRTAPLRVVWPSWWDVFYTPPPKGTPTYLVPSDVRRGDPWTNLLTRSSGSWEPSLSGYIQTLLSAMYTRRGRWTLDLAAGRAPVLVHRDMLTAPDNGTAILDMVDPLLELVSLDEDWSQQLDAIYTQGTSLAGVAYSGMQVSADGSSTFYAPAAARRQVWPDDNNAWRDLSVMTTETLLQALPGLSEDDAMKMAVAHLERFGDPGVTGSLTIHGDITLGDGSVIPHHLVRAGMSAQLKHLFGHPEGALVHLSDSTTDFMAGTTTVTFDSKYRDALTVGQVRVRGRDAMAIPRMLAAGNYTPPIPDQLVPWSYAEGAGIIPAPPKPGLGIFAGMPDSTLFPWESWTKAHPPKDARWKPNYVEIGPASANADKNWSGRPRARGGVNYSLPIRMSQAGTIRLIQIAAFDKWGNVLRVPFHVSFYYMSGAHLQDMPKIPAYQPDPKLASYYPYHHPPFAVGQHYPYVVNAWETYNPNGTLKNTEVPDPVQTVQLWLAFGNDKVKAGYWPGDGYTGSPTGLFVDETPRQFDTSQAPGFNPYTASQSTVLVDRPGFMFVMFYCDAQQDGPVYFLGRMFRADPGSNGGQ